MGESQAAPRVAVRDGFTVVAGRSGALDVARTVHPGGVCMLTVGTEAPGTPESSWRASGRLADSPAMSWGVAGRVVVLAPHPDDEVLAVGGALGLEVVARFHRPFETVFAD